MTNIGYKVFISANFLTLFNGNIEERGIISSSIKLYTKSDVNNLLTSFISAYNKIHELGYNYPFQMANKRIRVAKVKSLTGSSYIELPKNILNKKAVINCPKMRTIIVFYKMRTIIVFYIVSCVL